MTQPSQLHGNLPEVVAGRLLVREQLSDWPRQIRWWFRRLLRTEPRYFLFVDGWVIARFTSQGDAQIFLDWLGQGHRVTLEAGMRAGREHYIADLKERIGTLGSSQSGPEESRPS